MNHGPSAIYNTQDILEVHEGMIKDFKKRAAALPWKRFRLCLHDSNNHPLQEMLIVAQKNSYFRPHRHPDGKAESYHVIEGTLTVYYFDHQGKVTRSIELGVSGGKQSFMQRLSKSIWHMPVPSSRWTVYHEVYPGPFIKEADVEYAPWAPEEKDPEAVKRFFADVRKEARRLS